MSTFKTVLITAAVLLLGSALLAGGFVIWSQQQSIDDLSVHVYLLNKQMEQVQNRTDDNTDRINKAIKTTNKNFSRIKTEEENLESLVKLLAKIILSSASDDPTSLNKGM